MVKRQTSSLATGNSLLQAYDYLIRKYSYQTWRELSPASCDWQDIAQEVRIIFLAHQQQILAALHQKAFASAIARNEARRAMKHLCYEELHTGSLRVGSEPATEQMFYSSDGSPSDVYID